VAGYLSLVLHAHLPFVRHPEHDRFLEESWLFEAVIEVYIPLLQLLERWRRDGVKAPLTITLSPTLCAMLQDGLLQERVARRLDDLIALTEKEIQRTHWQPRFRDLALFYQQRLNGIRETYAGYGRDLLGAFRQCQDNGQVEIITTAATHALLPLLASHPPSLRAQIMTARDHYRSCFGREPRGIWLPECAWAAEIEPALREAGLRWFILDSHGILHARPQPRYSIFAPLITPGGLAAFGRDLDSARQVWSRQEGYPGDPRYRDFYRDAGFDLDMDYVRAYLPANGVRGFTGLKYFRITGAGAVKEPYDRGVAVRAADEHARHFLSARLSQIEHLEGALDRPPLVLCPYDAELLGHWWYEGPEFLDFFVRKAFFDQKMFTIITPEQYLERHPVNQMASPAASSWGEHGYWGVWLNEQNEWIYAHLRVAQERMTELVRKFGPGGAPLNEPEEERQSGGKSDRQRAKEMASSPPPSPRLRRAGQPTPPEKEREKIEASESFGSQTNGAPTSLQARALKQAGRELLLAQASDWPFMLRTGTNADYARKRVKDHLLHFTRLYERLMNGGIDETRLSEMEGINSIFPDLDYRYWR